MPTFECHDVDSYFRMFMVKEYNRLLRLVLYVNDNYILAFIKHLLRNERNFAEK